MVVCKYFIEGRCRFGNSCQYEHSGQPSSSSSSFSSTHHQQQSRSTGQNNIYSRLGFCKAEANLRKDLIEERPIYRYSVFAPMKDEPNMIEGTDFSPEELRLEYYNINNTYGNDAQYVRAQQGVRDLEERMQSKIDSILKDVSGVGGFQQQQNTPSIFGTSSSSSLTNNINPFDGGGGGANMGGFGNNGFGGGGGSSGGGNTFGAGMDLNYALNGSGNASTFSQQKTTGLFSSPSSLLSSSTTNSFAQPQGYDLYNFPEIL
nr:8010_t:CDS:2 [Entrophospora candida]